MDDRDVAMAVPSTSYTCNLHFKDFVGATTLAEVLEHHKKICEVLSIKPKNISDFYSKIKAEIVSWKATPLWSKFDDLLKFPCYEGGKACSNVRVLVIGAGPCGLRIAIECQLLGAKVVVVEKRNDFSRNNVLHLWPFVIQDLRRLGIKTFVGKFCARAAEHISIRQLQLVLSKVALLLGVEVRAGVSCSKLIQPNTSSSGWRADLSSKALSEETFDAVIGATGKQGDVLGFKKTEFRGKLAIAITANFINRHTKEEEAVPEISGVAYIFNQQFFKNLKGTTGIDLENILYFKDDTHYFIMTAKRQCLLEKKVLIKDHKSPAQLLETGNINKAELQRFIIDAVAYATNNNMPHFDFAISAKGQPDIAIFDFTLLRAAHNSCKVIKRKKQSILLGIVGDNLIEPFWPTGSGCARGFLSAFDAAWMIRNWASGNMTPLQVIAERESIHKLLPQTTAENLKKEHHLYTADPKSRYPCLNLQAVGQLQVESLYDCCDDISPQTSLTGTDKTSIKPLYDEFDYNRMEFTESEEMANQESPITNYKTINEPRNKQLDSCNVRKAKQDWDLSIGTPSLNENNNLRFREPQKSKNLITDGSGTDNSKMVQSRANHLYSDDIRQECSSTTARKNVLQHTDRNYSRREAKKLTHGQAKTNTLPEDSSPSLDLCIKFTIVTGALVALSYFWYIFSKK